MDDFRSNQARVLFTANYHDAFECLETCPKYNRATASLFSDENEMSKLLTFVANTTTDPVTETFYKDITASQIWLGKRYVQRRCKLEPIIIYVNFLKKGTSQLRGCGVITTQVRILSQYQDLGGPARGGLMRTVASWWQSGMAGYLGSAK